jgi:hypothetical protein
MEDLSVLLIAVAQLSDPVPVGDLTGAVTGGGQTCIANQEIHIKRQATRHGCQPSLLGHGDKWIEMVFGEEKIVCTELTSAAKTEQKSLVPARQAQRTNQGRGPLLYVLLESPFASVSTVSRGHPSLVSLCKPLTYAIPWHFVWFICGIKMMCFLWNSTRFQQLFLLVI